jgi:hypothetical protein
MTLSTMSLTLRLITAVIALSAGNALAQRDWAFQREDEYNWAAILTSAPQACLDQIATATVHLQGKRLTPLISTDWFKTTPYVKIAVEGRSYGFLLGFDEYDQQCQLIDRIDGRTRKLPACSCAYAEPARAARPRGQHLVFIRANSLMKALEQGCSATAAPAGPAVAEYRKTLQYYFTFKTKAPELAKKADAGYQRAAWEFGKALAALQRDEFDPALVESERAKLISGSPGLEAMCHGARELLADRTAQIVLEMKAEYTQGAGRAAHFEELSAASR